MLPRSSFSNARELDATNLREYDTKRGTRMSKKATEFQRKSMSRMYRGKEIFKPLNTGWIDENVACAR